jgi:hypothetical protein
MQLTIDFTAEQELGITAAREAHNANPPSESDAPFTTNEEYVTWVMQKASDSYATQYQQP